MADETKKAMEKTKADAKTTGAKVKKEAGAVAAEAKNAAAEVKGQAKQAAGDVAETAMGELEGALEEQKAAGAERAQRIAGAIDRAGDDLGQEIPMVGDVMHRAAQEIEHIAAEVRDRDPRELLGVAQDFARRQPALFAGAIGLAGFAAARFLMASSGSSSQSGRMGGSAQSDATKPFVPAKAPQTGATASGDPGGVDPAAPGFGGSNTEPRGEA